MAVNLRKIVSPSRRSLRGKQQFYKLNTQHKFVFNHSSKTGIIQNRFFVFKFDFLIIC